MGAKRGTAYVLRTATQVEPFGDPGWRMPVLGKPLVTCQRETLEDAGLTVREVDDDDAIAEPGIAVADDLFFTPAALRKFLKETDGTRHNLRLGVRPNVFTRRTTELAGNPTISQDDETLVPYDLWRVAAPGTPLAEARHAPLTLWERITEPAGIDAFRPEGMDLRQGLTHEVVLKLDHWTQMVYANLLSGPAWWLEHARRHPLWFAWRVLTSFSLNVFRIGGRVNRIGRGCHIHPQASLEGCVIGDNVTIGPHATLQGSFVGDGAHIEPLSRVFFSTVGGGCTVATHSQVLMSVIQEGSLVSQPGVQLSVVGREAKLLVSSKYLDLKYKRPIKVTYRGQRVALGTNNMGVAIGHRAVLAAMVMVDAGMSIPNDVVIVPDGGQIVARFPEEYPTGTPLVVKGRTVEPLFPKEQPPARG